MTKGHLRRTGASGSSDMTVGGGCHRFQRWLSKDWFDGVFYSIAAQGMRLVSGGIRSPQLQIGQAVSSAA